MPPIGIRLDSQILPMKLASWFAAALVGVFSNNLLFAAEYSEAELAFAAGNRYFEIGDFEQALLEFRTARAVGMQTPAVLYNIGVCEYRGGYYAESVETFGDLSVRYPSMQALANYNMGLALVRLDQKDAARAALRRARIGGDDTLVRLTDELLARLDGERNSRRAPSPKNWYGFMDAGFGHDDNVALLDDSSIPTGQTTESAFGEFFGQAGWSPGSAGKFRLNASTYVVRYADASEFNQAALRLGAAWQWTAHRWRLGAEPYYSYSILDADGFEQRLGISLAAYRDLSPATQFSVRVVHENINEISERFDFVAGHRELLGLNLVRRDEQQRANLSYELSVDERASAAVSPVRHRFRAGYRRIINANWSVGAELSFRSSRYDDLDGPRDEDLGEAALSVARSLSSVWQLTGQYRYSNNESNIVGFSYDRQRISVALNRTF